MFTMAGMEVDTISSVCARKTLNHKYVRWLSWERPGLLPVWAHRSSPHIITFWTLQLVRLLTQAMYCGHHLLQQVIADPRSRGITLLHVKSFIVNEWSEKEQLHAYLYKDRLNYQLLLLNMNLCRLCMFDAFFYDVYLTPDNSYKHIKRLFNEFFFN